jgi:hypothetical protein
MSFKSNDTIYCPCLSGGGGSAPQWPLSGSEDDDEMSPGKGFRPTSSVKKRSAKGHGVGVGEWGWWDEKDNVWIKERGHDRDDS